MLCFFSNEQLREEAKHVLCEVELRDARWSDCL
jgi:hypothetical protein